MMNLKICGRNFRPQNFQKQDHYQKPLLKKNCILESVALVVTRASPGERPFCMEPDYEADNVSKKVVRIIMSYTDYVNRTV